MPRRRRPVIIRRMQGLPRPRASKLALLLILGLLLAYALTSPATVNGDGVGYLRQALGRDLAPGHLAYLPLLRLLSLPSPPRAPIDLERRARWLSILCAAATLALFFDGARRLRGDPGALFATALLGLSHGFFRSAQEVEVYAASELLATACLWSLLRLLSGPPRQAPGWAAAAGLSCGFALLFHLSLALLAPALLLMLVRLPPRPQRRRCLLIGGTALVLAGGLPLLLFLAHQGRLEPAAAFQWLRSADHGLPYPHTALTPLVAAWGLSRSLVYAPYPYEATAPLVGLLSAAGLLAWASLLLAWRRRRLEQPLPRPARELLLAWSAPLAAFGLLFYPSDTERWIFLLPALALLLAPAASRRTVALIVGVALLNFVSAGLPQALDDDAPRRAAAVDRLVQPDDLVISPGHGWDELIGLRSSAPPQRFILAYFVGSERSLESALARLRLAIEQANRRGERVFVARLQDTDRRGFKELARLGLPPERFAALFAPHQPRPTSAAGLWLLSDLSAGRRRPPAAGPSSAPRGGAGWRPSWP